MLLAICMGHIKLYDKHLYYMCVKYYMSDVLDKGINCTYSVHSLCYVFISGTQFTLAFKCVGNTTGPHSELFVEILSRGRYHLCDIQCNRILRECLPLLELKLGSQDVLTFRSLQFAVKQSKAEMSSHSTVCQMIHDPGEGGWWWGAYLATHSSLPRVESQLSLTAQCFYLETRWLIEDHLKH